MLRNTTVKVVWNCINCAIPCDIYYNQLFTGLKLIWPIPKMGWESVTTNIMNYQTMDRVNRKIEVKNSKSDFFWGSIL